MLCSLRGARGVGNIYDCQGCRQALQVSPLHGLQGDQWSASQHSTAYIVWRRHMNGRQLACTCNRTAWTLGKQQPALSGAQLTKLMHGYHWQDLGWSYLAAASLAGKHCRGSKFQGPEGQRPVGAGERGGGRRKQALPLVCVSRLAGAGGCAALHAVLRLLPEPSAQ